ncbi:MAG: hypothetical protein K2H43_06150 [Clostridia bacterium]|nr:hypothetical protein [Clostridia bacterium]
MKTKLKAFFKSNTFRCVTVLLCIVLVSGALLAIFNDLLYVSAEERFARTLSKIYGKEVATTELAPSKTEYSSGTVDAAYLVDDGNYLVQTTGNNGYSNGTVTLWTVFSCDGSKQDGTLAWKGIEKVVYESNTKQSYVSKIKQKYYTGFTVHNEELLAGGKFTAEAIAGGGDIYHVSTGASRSSAAICNAVNTALAYFRAEILGGEA